MNDDDPREMLAMLKAEHRRLDEEIERCGWRAIATSSSWRGMKKRKLTLKDEIQQLADRIIPDIIA